MSVQIPVQPATLGISSRVAGSIRKRGVLATVRLAMCALRETCRRNLTWNPFNPWRQYLDRRYDARWVVDTAGIDWIEDVQSNDANAYSPVPRSTFLRKLRLIEADYSKFVFIDLGCGKGKALLLASEFPFKRVVGVELSSRLAEAAGDNLRSLQGCRKVPPFEVVAGDAREFSFPAEPLVIFLYDPFKADVMEAVVEQLRRSVEAVPRTAYVIYLDPSHHHVFDRCDTFCLVQHRRDCRVYATRP